MKKSIGLILTIAFLSMAGTSAYSQFRKIPAEVTEAFAQRFPGATKVEWRDKLTGYQVEFEQNGKSLLANFSNKAEWESTEEEVGEAGLPGEVKDGIGKSKYSEWTISKVDKIDLPSNETQYRVQISSGDIKKRNLYFSAEGRLLKDKITI